MFEYEEQPKRYTLPVIFTLPLLFFVAAASAFAAVYIVDRKPAYNPELPPYTSTPVNFEYGARPELANAEYFSQVRDQFVFDKADFIEADLSRMRIRVYEKGSVVKDVAIKSKGREGSWWETPAGLYQIELKERNHFSSFGHVYQPWSMVFQGNFFIHGWPYYPDGTPVAEGYSGGCIRLADGDAEDIYKLAKTGMPVLVHSDSFKQDSFSYAENLPQVSANQYLVADLDNNYVFLEKGADQIVPIASLTKLVTALVASEYINLDKPITISAGMLATTSLPRLSVGEKIRALDLLYPLLLESSNEAAHALAQTIGEKRFVALMNKKAQALGMLDTKFVDPAGSGSENVSTTQDLFQLVKYLKNNRSFILRLTTGKLDRAAYGSPYFKNVHNFNIFGGNPSFLGGKVGQTIAAQETMVALFEVPYSGIPRPVVVIALGSKDVAKDVPNMIKYVGLQYRADINASLSQIFNSSI